MVGQVLGDVGGRPYSPGIKAGNLVFISGQLGLGAEGNLVTGGIEAETKQALENVKKIVQEAGGSLANIVKTTVYLTSLDYYKGMNKVYSEYFPENPPARATIGIRELVLGAVVEIEAIAVVG